RRNLVMNIRQITNRVTLAIVVLSFAGCAASVASNSDGSSASTRSKAGTTAAIKLINVSYDPTRELYAEFNKAFAQHWLEEHGHKVTIDQYTGGSRETVHTG